MDPRSTILGIETSCDETAAAVVTGGRVQRSSIVSSQTAIHAPFGGVVPELACRAHAEQVGTVVEAALAQAKTRLADCDAIAVTTAPGLVGALLVGMSAAKGLALGAGKPLVPVNHLEAHVAAVLLLPGDLPFPCVSLVVSGGHTILFRSTSPTVHERLGATTDDAAGEAFDKAAATLGLGYPGGPLIERTAATGDPRAVDLPRSLLGPDSLDFSFSGLKTALLYAAAGTTHGKARPTNLAPQRVADLAASFQAAVVDVLVEKARRALAQTGLDRVVVCGGVACNGPLRTRMAAMCDDVGAGCVIPPPRLCTDNAAMVAALGAWRFAAGATDGLALDVDATPVRTRAAAAR